MKPVVWRTQGVTPKQHYLSQAILHFTNEIEKQTGGKLRLEFYPSGGMSIPIPKTVSAVRDRLMNMGEILGAQGRKVKLGNVKDCIRAVI